MYSGIGSFFGLGAGLGWPVAADIVLSVLLLFFVLRYRSFHRASLEARRDVNDLIDNLAIGIYRSTPDGRQLSANRALVKLNGYASEAEMLASVHDIGKEWYVKPGRREEFRAALKRDGKVEDFVSEIYRHKTRERIWVTESARLVYHRKTGRPLYYEGSVRDITETVRRLQQEEQFQKLTRRLPVGLFQFLTRPDGSSDILYLSEGAFRIHGIPVEEHKADPDVFNGLVLPEDRQAYTEAYLRAQQTMAPWDHEFRIRARDGQEKWVRINAQPEPTDEGAIIWHGYISDVSVRKKHEMEIQELAYFDPLTKLPNRRMFLTRMGQAIAGCERRNDHAALLFVDLDNFKTLNDTQGHDVGDLFLTQVADRLRRCVNPRDTVARIGGDEFVVIIEEIGADTARATVRAITSANQVLSALRGAFDLGALRHVASASVGVVVFDGKEKRADEIMKRADIAMYQAKAGGRNGMALFDPASLDRESQRYRLLSDLRLAFPRKELDLHFQPQVDDTGKVCAAEALVRWRHPTLGMIMPDQFIPLAEQFGLAGELERFVFDRGFAALASWRRDPAMAHLRLSLNVSVQAFAADDFVPTVKQMATLHGVDPSRLTFELTEHVMARDHARIAQRMSEVKQLGIRLSLDDFGTGYSSLAYLKQLPFDEVKIDGGFVTDIETTESDRALVKTILAMARILGLTAVAEHVENVRQEAFLRAFGCDFFQGYLYSQPLPEAAFRLLFADHADAAIAAPQPLSRSA